MKQLLTMLATLAAVLLGWKLSQREEQEKEHTVDAPISDPNMEPVPEESAAPVPQVKPTTGVATPPEVESPEAKKARLSPKWQAGVKRSIKAFLVTVISALAVNGVAIVGAVAGLFNLSPDIIVSLTAVVSIIGMGLEKVLRWTPEEKAAMQIDFPEEEGETK